MSRQTEQARYHRAVAQRRELMSEREHALSQELFERRLRLVTRIINNSWSCDCTACTDDPFLA